MRVFVVHGLSFPLDQFAFSQPGHRLSRMKVREPQPSPGAEPVNGHRDLAAIVNSERWARLVSHLKLSPRERQIIECILGGADGEDVVARRLGISSHTVHTHVERLYRKLRVTSRSQLVASLFITYASSDSGDEWDTNDPMRCRSRD